MVNPQRRLRRRPRVAALLCGLLLVAGVSRALCAGPAAAIAVAPRARPVALVTDLAGRSTLQRAGTSRAVALLEGLQPQDQLRLAPGATLELAFTAGAGSIVSLSGPGRFRVDADAVQARGPGGRVQRRELAAAWRGWQMQAGLVGRASIALRGFPGNRIALRAPAGAQAAQPPQLTWDQPYGRPAGAWNYTVRVIDDAGRLVYAAQLPERTLQLPATLAWERGRDYLWTVRADAPGRLHAQGAVEFRLLEAAAQRRIDALTTAVVQARRDPARPESSAEEVLLALAYEQEGLRDAARQQWQALAPLRPALAQARVAAD